MRFKRGDFIRYVGEYLFKIEEADIRDLSYSIYQPHFLIRDNWNVFHSFTSCTIEQTCNKAELERATLDEE